MMGHADTADIQLGFEFRRKVEPVNWKKIASIDIDRICHELDFQALQDNVTHVTFCNIESEVDTKKLDPSFVKLFRLSQLIIEYLLNTQEYLSNNLDASESKNETLEKEIQTLRENLSSKEKMFKEIKKENRKRRLMIEEQQKELGLSSNKTILFQCPFCPKSFMSPFYLQNHSQRRHSRNKNQNQETSEEPEQPSLKKEILTLSVKETQNQEQEKMEMMKFFEEWKKFISLEREEQKQQTLLVNEKLIKELDYLKRRQEEAEKELAELRKVNSVRVVKSASLEKSSPKKSPKRDEERRSLEILHLNLENRQREEVEQLKQLLKEQELKFSQEVKNSIAELKRSQQEGVKEQKKVFKLNEDSDEESNNQAGNREQIRNYATRKHSWDIKDKNASRHKNLSDSGEDEEPYRPQKTPKEEIIHLLSSRSSKRGIQKPKEKVIKSPILKFKSVETSSTEDSEEELPHTTNKDVTFFKERTPAEKPFTSSPSHPLIIVGKDLNPSPLVIEGLKKELNSVVDERINAYQNKVGSKVDLEKTMKLLEKNRSKQSKKIPNFELLREKWRSLITKKISTPGKSDHASPRKLMENLSQETTNSTESPAHSKNKIVKADVLGSPINKTVSLPEYRPITAAAVKEKTLKEKAKSDGELPVKKLSFTEPEMRILNVSESSEEESSEDEASDIEVQEIGTTIPSPVNSKRTPDSNKNSRGRETNAGRMYSNVDSESQEEIESVESEVSDEEEEEEEETTTERVIKVRPPTSYKVAQLASSIEQQLAKRHNPSNSNDTSLTDTKRRLAGSVDTLAPFKSFQGSHTTIEIDKSFYGSTNSTLKIGSTATLEESSSVSSLEKLMQEIVAGNGKVPVTSTAKRIRQEEGNYNTHSAPLKGKNRESSSWDSELDLT